MGRDKGKSRASHDEPVDKAQLEGSQNPSISSRVATSASGLARSAFGSPHGNELNQNVAAALAQSGKWQSASTGVNTAWAENSGATQQSIRQTGSSSAFRPGQNEEHIRQSESEFSAFLDGVDTFTPSRISGDDHPETLSGLGEAWTRSQPTGNASQHRTVAEQEMYDGKEVLSILSAPGGMESSFEAPPPEDEENYGWGLTQEQLIQLRAMTKDILPPPETHSGVSPENPLNLVPHRNDPDFFNSQSEEAVVAWREQWQDVLSRYTDEVWGGLLPLVKEARKEVEDLRSHESSTTQPKALRRLGAILGHIRQY
jgi:hypothetical protein